MNDTPRRRTQLVLFHAAAGFAAASLATPAAAQFWLGVETGRMNELEYCGNALLAAGQGILYAPDYVVSAAGIVNVSVERHPGAYNEAVAMEKRIEAPSSFHRGVPAPPMWPSGVYSGVTPGPGTSARGRERLFPLRHRSPLG